MKYERPPYMAPGVKTMVRPGRYGSPDTVLPVPDYPISMKENVRRAAKRENPLWVTNSALEMNMAMLFMVTGIPEAQFGSKERHEYDDWFGARWMFVPEAGGPMLKPGTQVMDDITQWEKKVKFPSFGDWPIREKSEAWRKTCDPEKICHVNVGLGCTERLVSLMGGYTDAMLAMAMEPEAVRDFLEAFVDFDCSLIDELCKYLPIDLITYHDDWGTERETFFGESMMESMVFEPTKRFFDHCHSRGILVQHHCCGRIGRFIPYDIAAGTDFMQIQARANDIPAYKERWGDKIGFEIAVRPEKQDRESVIRAVRDTVDTYGKGGGLFSSVMARDPKVGWDAIMELYCYSREKYDAEQGRE